MERFQSVREHGFGFLSLIGPPALWDRSVSRRGFVGVVASFGSAFVRVVTGFGNEDVRAVTGFGNDVVRAVTGFCNDVNGAS
jgi:hypothetical protein